MDVRNLNQASGSPSVPESKLEKYSFWVLIATIFVGILSFVPSNYIPFELTKTVVFVAGISISSILYILSSIKNKTGSYFKKNALFYSAWLIVLSLVLSSIFSDGFSKSFFGQGFEISTGGFLLLMFIALALVARLVANKDSRVFNVYTTIFSAFAVLAIIHIIRFIGGPNSLTLGYLHQAFSTFVGKWHDLGVLSAVVASLLFFVIKFLNTGTKVKWVSWVSFVVALIFFLVSGTTNLWIAFLIMVLGVLIYEYAMGLRAQKSLKSRFSLFTVVVLLIAIACVWKGDVISAPLISAFKVDNTEIVLPWQYTLDIDAQTIKESPIFGAGPNRFQTQFIKYKPLDINLTPFWNTEFPSGFSTLSTFVANQGILGAVSWLLFLIFFIHAGLVALKSNRDGFPKFALLSSFFVSSFLWLVNILYTPSHVIIFLTFVFTGLFISLAIEPRGNMADAQSSKLPSVVFYFVGLVIIVLGIVFYAKKTIAVAYFQSGIKEYNTTSSFEKAQTKFKKALVWDNADIYYQALSEMDNIEISSRLNKLSAAGTPDQKAIQDIGALIDEAIGYSKKAISLDPKNYYNYFSQARIAEVAASLKVPNSYEMAREAYTNAVKYNPYGPGLYLLMARLDYSQNKLDLAELDVRKALILKSNYTDAIFLLSQIQIANGQLKEAIESTKAAVTTDPKNPLLYFGLGLLYYNDKNYADAITALEKAVSLNDQYANARYFLGLSYVRVNRINDAITQFENIQKTNPDNAEVQLILTNLKAGKSPFSDVKPPLDNKPEKRATLPVVEKKDKTTTVKP